MKNLIIALLLFTTLLSCEKEKQAEPAGSASSQTGTWRIYAVGNPQDSFTFKIWSSVDTLYNVEIKGIVSGGPVSIPMYSGNFYQIGYRNTTCDSIMSIDEHGDTTYSTYCIKLIEHQGSYSQQDFIDSIPATIY
jgi:hypothetical protein